MVLLQEENKDLILKGDAGRITQQNSRLIIEIFGIKYYISINGINEALNRKRIRLIVRNFDNNAVGGTSKISNDRKYFDIFIGGVTFYSDIEQLIKLMNNQISEVNIFNITADPKPEVNYPYGKTIAIVPVKPQDPEIDSECSFYLNQKIVTDNQDQFFIEKVAGVTFENRQDKIKKMKGGDKIILQREPDNSYDKNAIRVLTQLGEHIGYISKIQARFYAPKLDNIKESVCGEVYSINGGYDIYSNYGVTIRFRIPPSQQL